MKTEYHYSTERIGHLKALYTCAASRHGARIFIRALTGDTRLGYTFQKFARDTDALGTTLCARGLLGRHVLLMGENGYAWALSFMALACGGVAVPVDKALGEEELAAIASASDAVAILYSPTCADALERLPRTLTRISFDELPSLISEGYRLMRAGEHGYLDAEPEPDALCALVHNPAIASDSPALIMLSHRNVCFSIAQISRMLRIDEDDIFLSVLPMHHVLEWTCSYLLPLWCGAAVAFGDGLRALSRSMRELEPSVMVCVPPILQTLYTRMQDAITQSKHAKTLTRTLKTVNSLPGQRLRDVARRRALAPFHEMLGGRLRLLLSGGAPCDPYVLSQLRAMGIRAYQCYTVSECAPIAALNGDDGYKDDSLGVALPDALLDIYDMHEDGSGMIRCKSESVTSGYYKSPALTQKFLRDGWFYTGDTGYLDDDGFLYLTGSRRNTIVTAGGKSIAPEALEAALADFPCIREALAVGYLNTKKNDYDLVALICPDSEYLESRYGSNPPRAQIDLEIRRALSRANTHLPPHMRIKGYLIRSTPLPRSTSGKPLRATAAEEHRSEYLKKLQK